MIELGKTWKSTINRAAKKRPAINFAWEHPEENLTLELSKEAFRQADIIVAIGYTFPFFNRMIDNQLLDIIQTWKNVELRIQDPNAETIVEKVESMLSPSHKDNVKVVPYNYIDQFYIPINL